MVRENKDRLKYSFSRAVNRRVAAVGSLIVLALVAVLFASKQNLYGWALLPAALTSLGLATSFGDVTLLADRNRGVLEVRTHAPLMAQVQEYRFGEIDRVVHDFIIQSRRQRFFPTRYFIIAILKDGRQKVLFVSPKEKKDVAERLNEFIQE